MNRQIYLLKIVIKSNLKTPAGQWIVGRSCVCFCIYVHVFGEVFSISLSHKKAAKPLTQ